MLKRQLEERRPISQAERHTHTHREAKSEIAQESERERESHVAKTSFSYSQLDPANQPASSKSAQTISKLDSTWPELTDPAARSLRSQLFGKREAKQTRRRSTKYSNWSSARNIVDRKSLIVVRIVSVRESEPSPGISKHYSKRLFKKKIK